MTTNRMMTASVSRALSVSDGQRRSRFIKGALALSTALCPVWVLADTLPTGGNVVAGAAQISTPAPNAMTINQSSDRAVVNWDGFSIGQGSRVDIQQPNANSAILNRVTGNTTSQIHGQLNANGRVFVVNPNGIFIGPTGSVNTGSFVASTLGIRTDDFVTGKTVFEGNGSSATVENAGNVQVVTGGYAALIGGKVKNSGTIQAPLGFVGLGSGERVTLDLAGDGFLQVALPTNSEDDGVEALIENSGTIQANGGTVQISAATARNAARHAINLSGVVEARTVSGRNGRITLGGGGGGKVTVSGKVRTRSRPAIQVTESARPAMRPERGGDITITGRDIVLTGAEIDASGDAGGGSVRIGGEFQGGPGLPTAETLSVDAGTIIRADAGTSGDGGRVILWSDVLTSFEGSISARGGSNGGDGGFAEVSGKDHLRFKGMADLRAPSGAWGTLLLDPTDIEIVDFDPPGADQIFNEDVENALSLGNVLISTADNAGDFPFPADATEDGTITVEAPIAWGEGTQLTLEANTDILINAPISATAGTLNLDANGEVLPNQAGEIAVNDFILTDGDWRQVDPNLADFSVARNFVIQSGRFLRALGGDGSGELGSGSPYQITDVYGLQGVATVASSEDNFSLANDIDASLADTWVSLLPPVNGESNEGFVPLFFSGNLDGDDRTIDGLTVRQLPATGGDGRPAGLFRSLGNGAIASLRIVNADISGDNAGILAGQNFGASVEDVFVSGTVTSFGGSGGGLIGLNSSSAPISRVRADVTVRDGIDPANDSGPGGTPAPPASVNLGGLVGFNDFFGGEVTITGNIDTAEVRGSVSSTVAETATLGGVVGVNEGILTNVFSDVAVTASTPGLNAVAFLGGLAGSNTQVGEISFGIAVGPVTVSPGFSGTSNAFAIVGDDSSTLTENDPGDRSIFSVFWDVVEVGQTISGQVGETAGSTFNGPNGAFPFEGALGETTDFLQNSGDFFEVMVVSGFDFLNVWAPPLDTADYARLYATSPVIFAIGPDNPNFTYNASVNQVLPTATYIGGPDNGNANSFQFGPRGDGGTPPLTDAAVILNDPNVSDPVMNETTFTFPTDFTSTLDQDFTVRSIPQQATVNPAPLVVTVGNVTKAFNTELAFADVPFTADALLGTDTITSGTVISDGAPAIAPVGTYDLDLADFDGPGIENYTIETLPGTLTVGGRQLDININNASKTYGDTLLFNGTEFTTVGLLEGDTVTSLTITSEGAAPEAQVADGPFDINGSNPVGSGLGNYIINIVPGVLTIIPAPLTITADDQTRPFGAEFTFEGDEFTVSGLVNDDSVESATLVSDGTDPTLTPTGEAGVAVVISDPEGSGLENYQITLVNGIFVIAPGDLIITANDQSKVYGTEFTFDGTEFTVVGLAEGDSVDSVTLISDGAAGTAQVAGSPFAIEASDAVGSGLENYTLVFEDGSFVVVPAPLTVTANDQTKQQGQVFTFDGTEFTTTGLLNDDSVDTAVLTSDGAAAEASTDDSPFEITVGDLTGTGLDNYNVSRVSGTFTVDNLVTPPQVNPVPGGNRSLGNPGDTISIAFPGGDGPAGGLNGSGGPQQTLGQAEATLAAVDSISSDFETAIQSCGSADQDFTNYMACLSESLDTYANALDQIADNLPSGLETVSATIRTARDGVNAATARAQRRLATATSDAERSAIRAEALAEARGAIDEARTEIRKAISLIRADDPEVLAVQQETGARIIQAFDTVDSELARAVEL